jgi:hypothetical protein
MEKLIKNYKIENIQFTKYAVQFYVKCSRVKIKQSMHAS